MTSLAAPILLGLALAGIGILLLAVAFSSVSMGRPITRAWIFAAPGLVFLVPGVVVAARGLFSAFLAGKGPPAGPSGPPQPRSS